jgi:hypothetical protein
MYITIEIKEVTHIGYNGFLFPHLYTDEGQGAEKETCYIKYRPLLLFQ